MKFLFLLFGLLAIPLHAQTNLQFDKRLIECEDKWVAFNNDKDSSYLFGFIYIDGQAGLTLNHEGTFRYTTDRRIVVEKLSSNSIKYRLQPSNKKVAILPVTMYKDLNIEAVPEWLSFYKKDTGRVKGLYQWGYIYNAWNECEIALIFLQRAREKDPRYEGLAVELAFSYNCLNEFQKAEDILEEEVKTNSSNAYVNKEYIFTLAKNKKIEKAVKQFKQSVKNEIDKIYNAENCYNIAQYFYNEKDKNNFNIWYKELSNWPNENENITKYAKLMYSEINK